MLEKRLDYILIDSTIIPAINNKGTLRLNDDIQSDIHKLSSRPTFKAITNRPVLNSVRDFVIEHTGKAETFIKTSKWVRL